jgi:hypothetical protein
MNEPETRRLLGYISAGYDNRALSEATAQVWAEELGHVDFQTAKEAVRSHFRKPKPREYLSLDVLLDQIKINTRQTSQAIEEDVRSAKARGLIGSEWSNREPLPHDVAVKLFEARQGFVRSVQEIESRVIAEPAVFAIGEVGKKVPRE